MAPVKIANGTKIAPIWSKFTRKHLITNRTSLAFEFLNGSPNTPVNNCFAHGLQLLKTSPLHICLTFVVNQHRTLFRLLRFMLTYLNQGFESEWILLKKLTFSRILLIHKGNIKDGNLLAEFNDSE